MFPRPTSSVRRALLVVCALVAPAAQAAAAAASQPSAPPGHATPTRPNVLLILVDDLNTRLSAYGHSEVRTPNIERLAERGRRFDRSYNQFPICNPSRASLLSGWRPQRTGVWSNRTPPGPKLEKATLLQDHFRSHGYLTVRVGKIYHVEEQFGWDLEEDPDYAPGKAPVDQLEPQEWTAEAMFAAKWAATDNLDGEEPDGRAARRAAELMSQSREQPLFMAVGLVSPHGPWVAPKRYFDMYPEEQMWLPPVVEGDLDDVPLTAMKRGAEPRIPKDKRRFALAAYSACVSFMDAQLGVILDTLDHLDLWDETVVVLVGDNGIHRGEHGIWKKNSLFEVSSRVPMVIAAPGLRYRGVASRSLVELVDIYPTLVELCGLPDVEGLEGTSLVPVLLDPSRRVKTAAFTYSERGGTLATSVRTERYRHTRWPNGTAELYDHAIDPGEIVNLADDPAYAEVVAELRGLVEAGYRKAQIEP